MRQPTEPVSGSDSALAASVTAVDAGRAQGLRLLLTVLAVCALALAALVWLVVAVKLVFWVVCDGCGQDHLQEALAVIGPALVMTAVAAGIWFARPS